MTRRHLLITALCILPIALMVVWMANHTTWGDAKVPMPPKGEALINPFYAVQRLADRLGANATWDRMLVVPRADAVIVVSTWHWSLSGTRRSALERWVESGGRLVVDDQLIDVDDEFEDWSGVVRRYPDIKTIKNWRPGPSPNCRTVREEFDGTAVSASDADALRLCDLGLSWLESRRTPRWALRDERGLQALRVSIGRGSVTVINTAAFVERALFDGDHGRAFVAASQLRRGDEVHFLSEDSYPSLLALTWRSGAPVVAIGLTLVAALLWRGAVRFGPLAPPTITERRSLADQIRGTGRFTLHHGRGRSLHAACVRALGEAARRRVRNYGLLTPDERVAALARLTGFDRDSLAAAIHHPHPSAAGDLRRTLALLTHRRQRLPVDTGSALVGSDLLIRSPNQLLGNIKRSALRPCGDHEFLPRGG